jgi:hypothetical protein
VVTFRQSKKEPLSGQTKSIVINLTTKEQRAAVALLCTQARKEFLQQAARAWHSEQESKKHSLLLDLYQFSKPSHNFIDKSYI